MNDDLYLQADDRHAEYMTDGEYLSGAAKFDARGRLIVPHSTDPTRGTGYAAFIDCINAHRPHCDVNRKPPDVAMREAA